MKQLIEIDTSEQVVVSIAEHEGTKSRLAELEFQLDQLQRLIYGARSERFVPSSSDPQQQSLFGEELNAVPQQQTIEVAAHSKKARKEKPVRSVIPAHFPRIEHRIEPDELPEGARQIGEEVTEQYHYSPAVIKVDRYVRPKYVMGEQIIVAPIPELPFPKSELGATLAAHIAVSKYCDHLPLHRQCKMLKRAGLKVSDSTIGGWMSATATLLEPLGVALRGHVLAQDYLQVDESPIPVQTDHKKGGTKRGYYWVYHAPEVASVYFDYRSGRSAYFPKEMLEDFQGALQTDGYGAYDGIAAKPGITALACMAHARRKFEQALDNDRKRASHALEMFKALYALERRSKDRGSPPELRYRYRRRYADPQLDRFKAWLDREAIRTAPKSPVGKAISYTLGLWPRLVAYTLDGRYLIDNNPVENTIRPMAVGRKNYLFAGSDRAASHAALLYSLIGSCKLQGIEPYAYLCDIIARISEHKANQLHELLPHRWTPNS